MGLNVLNGEEEEAVGVSTAARVSGVTDAACVDMGEVLSMGLVGVYRSSTAVPEVVEPNRLRGDEQEYTVRVDTVSRQV